MKARQRVLIPFTHGHSGSALLRRAGEISAAADVELLVVSVLDTRSGFEADGPAGTLPGDRAARLAPPEQKRLEHDLMRHGLDQAKATVIWGEPRTALSALIRSWRPDLVVCDGRTRHMLRAHADQEGPALMTIGRDGPLARFTGLFLPQTQGHA
ncbi:universal stress protein [Diaphorobacter sp.]|uniref:universal stress protein n=1 Tax=Diaphorobacter sp. TaxID=1934310 RepID=UPI0025882E7E|nr:universal stress protein [Diaphorobacter sp.]